VQPCFTNRILCKLLNAPTLLGLYTAAVRRGLIIALCRIAHFCGWCWSMRPSRPGESHPEPLTDPDVNLSIHPARATPRKPTGFRRDKEFLRLPVASVPTWVTCFLRSAGITPFPRYYKAVRPWSVRRYFQPRVVPLVPFPLPSSTRFSSSVRKPG